MAACYEAIGSAAAHKPLLIEDDKARVETEGDDMEVGEEFQDAIIVA